MIWALLAVSIVGALGAAWLVLQGREGEGEDGPTSNGSGGGGCCDQGPGHNGPPCRCAFLQ